jgi:hypothetical protein
VYHLPAEYLELREIQSRERKEANGSEEKQKKDEKTVNEEKTVKETDDVTIKKEDDELEDIFEEKNSQLASSSTTSTSSSDLTPVINSDYASALQKILDSSSAREFWLKFRREGGFEHKSYLQCQVCFFLLMCNYLNF